jgi:hypothetical protein
MNPENRGVFILGAKRTNLQVRIFIHAVLEPLITLVLGIFSALRSFSQVPWLRR